MFCKWLRDSDGIDTDALRLSCTSMKMGVGFGQRPTRTGGGPTSEAIPRGGLPHHSIEYFRKRDGEPLQFLPKLIAANTAKKLN